MLEILIVALVPGSKGYFGEPDSVVFWSAAAILVRFGRSIFGPKKHAVELLVSPSVKNIIAEMANTFGSGGSPSLLPSLFPEPKSIEKSQEAVRGNNGAEKLRMALIDPPRHVIMVVVSEHNGF